MKRNREARNFRVLGPDETASNRLDALFEGTDPTWMAATLHGEDMPEVRDWAWSY
jgi:xylulose-5-phosphate/fructose-6-phosphate phosphoketolase